MMEHRFDLIHDEEGTDPGDWLPSDEEHYNRVGPFCTEDGTPLSAQDWFARPDSDVSNWVSFGLVLETRCNAGHWHPDGRIGTALWGLDFLGYPYGSPPDPGTYELETLPDPYLQEVARELLAEAAR